MTIGMSKVQHRNLSKLKLFGWIRKEVAIASSNQKHALGRKHTEAAKQLMSKAKKGKPSPHKGKKQSESVVQAKSTRMTGRKLPPDTLESMRVAARKRKGIPRSQETRDKISASRRGKPQPNISKALKGKPSGMLGKTQSESTRLKISETKKKNNKLKREKNDTN